VLVELHDRCGQSRGVETVARQVSKSPEEATALDKLCIEAERLVSYPVVRGYTATATHGADEPGGIGEAQSLSRWSGPRSGSPGR
jgi:hypothetical protein